VIGKLMIFLIHTPIDQWKRIWFSMSSLQKIVILFILFLALNSINEIIYFQSINYYVRILLIYVIPLAFFSLFSEKFDIRTAVGIVSISGLLVGIETIYELLMVHPTRYEVLNFEYVKHVSGKELFQFITGIRPTGLIEHLHATGFVIGVSFVCGTLMFLYSKEKNTKYLYFIVSLILFASMISNGTRLLLVGLALMWVLLYFFDKNNRVPLYVHLLFLFLTFFSLYQITKENNCFWYSTYFQYPIKVIAHLFPTQITLNLLAYSNTFAAGNDSLVAMFGEGYDLTSPFNLLNMLAKLSIANIIFGTGLGKVAPYVGVDDDHLFFTQFICQLGVLGTMIFIALFITMFFLAYRSLRDSTLHSEIEPKLLLAFLILLFFSLLHSGVLMRKACWMLFCFAVSVALRLDNRGSEPP